jgi:hypothetical protein
MANYSFDSLSKRKKKFHDSFLKKCFDKFGDKYDYSLIDYMIPKNQKVKIVCKEHGVFLSLKSEHLRGINCPDCAKKIQAHKIKKSKEKTFNNEWFVKKAKGIHGDKYDYSLCDYKGQNKNIFLICDKHGKIEVNASGHLYMKSGCKICNFSKGEKLIYNYLKKLNFEFETQKRFDNLLSDNNCNLRFDFYIDSIKTAIEFDGEQHFKSIDVFGGKKGYLELKKNDKIKELFCKKNDINLIRIPFYDFKNIEKDLLFNLNEYILWKTVDKKNIDDNTEQIIKAMEIEGVGCVVQTTTQQRNPDGSYSLTDALTFVPNCKIEVIYESKGDKVSDVVGRKLVCSV